MGNKNKDVFVCLDCESTGLDPKKDKIIEVAAVRFTFDEILDQYETLIDPKCTIPQSSIEIHHITDDMIVGKPTIESILPELLSFIGNEIIVGHGIGFDIELITSASERGNIPCQLKNNRFIDTLRMARVYGDSPTNSLQNLRMHFNIPQEGAHRAMSDVIVNMEVFKQLAKRYRTVKDIFDLLEKPIMLKAMPLGKHKGRPLKDIPLEYLLWAANKDFDRDLLYTIRSEISRRKKGNLFQQAGNPFSGL